MLHLQTLSEFKDEIIFELGDFIAQLCCTEKSRRLAFQLRYKAYLKAGIIQENKLEEFTDAYDNLPNAKIHLIWHEGRPIASVRSSVWSSDYNWIPTEGIESFWVDAHRKIGLNNPILESSRFLVIPEVTRRKSLHVQLLLFRIQDLCSRVEGCDHIITIVREKHLAFYQRMLAFQHIGGPKKYDWVEDQLILLATTQDESRKVVTGKGMPPCQEAEILKYKTLSDQLKNQANDPSNN